MADDFAEYIYGTMVKTSEDGRVWEMTPQSERRERVSMSAYDLLPEEEREAIAWVRDHGGLESIKAQRRESIPRAAYERKKAGFLDHIAECEAALGRRRDAIARIARENDKLRFESAQMRPRLMPEGMTWPRFEDNELVRIGDEISWRDEGGVVNSIELQDGGYFTLHAADGAEDWILPQYFPGERVKRPAPKVLDADGVEIRVGDTVYDNELGTKATVTFVHEGMIDPNFPDHVIRCKSDDDKDYESHMFKPDQLTNRAPVLAADGRPLREGEHVYHVETGAKLVVKELPKPGEYQAVVVFAMPTSPASHLTSFDPDMLTHERPDSWERLERDANASTCTYFGATTKDCEICGHVSWECSYDKASDLVRRAKKLAERGA